MSSPKIGKPVAMARTDDDSWDITEGVGQTALGVAMARADEATSERPLFTDPYAQLFLDAAAVHGRADSVHLRLRRLAHQVVRRVLHRRRSQRHRAGGHPCRRPGRAGVAAAVG